MSTRKQSVSAAVATVAVMASVGFAGPAAAADKWMPDVKGEVSATNDVKSVTGEVELDLRLVPRHVNQVLYDYTNWAVCYSSPGAGKEIPQKSKRVILSLRRLNEKC